MSARRLPDDELDRRLREALVDDPPEELQAELRREARVAWRRAAFESRRSRWWDRLGVPVGGRPLLPQPALGAAALVMLAAGAVMQAAPAPPEVVESFRGRQARTRTARALGGAAAMECTVDVTDERGRRLRYRVDWRASGETRVGVDGAAGSSAHTLHVPEDGSSVLTLAQAAPATAPLDPALRALGAYLSPSALRGRLDAPWRPTLRGGITAPGAETFVLGPGLAPPGPTVAIDTTTHLPLRLDATDRDGMVRTAVCRWP